MRVKLKLTGITKEQEDALRPAIESLEKKLSETVDDELQLQLARQDAGEIATALRKPDAADYVLSFLEKWYRNGQWRGQLETEIRLTGNLEKSLAETEAVVEDALLDGE